MTEENKYKASKKKKNKKTNIIILSVGSIIILFTILGSLSGDSEETGSEASNEKNKQTEQEKVPELS